MKIMLTLYYLRKVNIMQERKKQLQVVNNGRVVEGTTCFAIHAKYEVDCKRQHCQHWISHSAGHNCVMITAQNGPHTLQTIGQIYDLTRMRICQIEKNIFEKIRKIS